MKKFPEEEHCDFCGAEIFKAYLDGKVQIMETYTEEYEGGASKTFVDTHTCFFEELPNLKAPEEESGED